MGKLQATACVAGDAETPPKPQVSPPHGVAGPCWLLVVLLPWPLGLAHATVLAADVLVAALCRPACIS